MPELPEVESAVRRLRKADRSERRSRDASAASSRAQAPALERAAPLGRGARVARVERRGKHQLMHLDDGRMLHAHFRMNGDWRSIDAIDAAAALRARVVDFDDGTRVVLDDPRALGTLELHAADDDARSRPRSRAVGFRAHRRRRCRRFAKRRGPIKPVLLDQRSSRDSATSTRRNRSGMRRSRRCVRATDRSRRSRSRALLAAMRKVHQGGRPARATRDSDVSRLARLRSRRQAMSRDAARRSSGSCRPGGRRITARLPAVTRAERQSSASSSAPLMYPVSGTVSTSG